jgi:hypothetical protein
LRSLPDNYAIAFARGESIVRMRELEATELRGLVRESEIRGGMEEIRFYRSAGFGVWNRTGAVALYVGGCDVHGAGRVRRTARVTNEEAAMNYQLLQERLAVAHAEIERLLERSSGSRSRITRDRRERALASRVSPGRPHSRGPSSPRGGLGRRTGYGRPRSQGEPQAGPQLTEEACDG